MVLEKIENIVRNGENDGCQAGSVPGLTSFFLRIDDCHNGKIWLCKKAPGGLERMLYSEPMIETPGMHG